jgi:hypothetical protein
MDEIQGSTLDQALGEGSKNALFLSAQVADFRIHVQNSHFGSYITFKTSMTDETLRGSIPLVKPGAVVPHSPVQPPTIQCLVWK